MTIKASQPSALSCTVTMITVWKAYFMDTVCASRLLIGPGMDLYISDALRHFHIVGQAAKF